MAITYTSQVIAKFVLEYKRLVATATMVRGEGRRELM